MSTTESQPAQMYEGCDRDKMLVGTGKCDAPTSIVFTCDSCHLTELLCAEHGQGSALHHAISSLLDAQKAGLRPEDARCQLEDAIIAAI